MKNFNLRAVFAAIPIIMVVMTGCEKQDSDAWNDETNSPAGSIQENSSETPGKVYPESPSEPTEPMPYSEQQPVKPKATPQ